MIPVATVVLVTVSDGTEPADQAVMSSAEIAVPSVGVEPASQAVMSSAEIAVPSVGVDPASQAVISSQATEVIVRDGAVPSEIVRIPFATEADAAVPALHPEADPTDLAV